ncbi:hypothetical protein AVEN_43276-1 [Araneus ventricosus]|uniref:PiggyBac transposable element-derived protein domain-containing protein n=1 Tax=Araneus ventricosus TaxID=182803 RepID=A0A4Y2GFT7_ARAVE|nr:hypothetical protein AVEN_43276-1 [Araneus ventricosus]
MDSEEYSESDSSYEDISDESDSAEDTLDAARNWCRIDQENLAPPPPRFPFSGNPGLNTRMDGSSPIEFFCIFFDDDIVGYIASETNRYAEDFIEKNDLTPSSRVQKWKDVDSSEIRVFLGIIIFQVLEYHRLERSPTTTRRSFQNRFNAPKGADAETIRKLFAKFAWIGRVDDNRVGNVGLRQTVVTPENVVRVSRIVQQNPRNTIRRIASETGLKRSSTQKILRNSLTMFPTKSKVIRLYP